MTTHIQNCQKLTSEKGEIENKELDGKVSDKDKDKKNPPPQNPLTSEEKKLLATTHYTIDKVLSFSSSSSSSFSLIAIQKQFFLKLVI